jgi:hypothetical protein
MVIFSLKSEKITYHKVVLPSSILLELGNTEGLVCEESFFSVSNVQNAHNPILSLLQSCLLTPATFVSYF